MLANSVTYTKYGTEITQTSHNDTGQHCRKLLLSAMSVLKQLSLVCA